jgi:hypothetical protein
MEKAGISGRFNHNRLLKSYCGGDLRPLAPNETVLEILTYTLVRSGFCALHLPTEALPLPTLATLFNSLIGVP